jgi:hypothetical protein
MELLAEQSKSLLAVLAELRATSHRIAAESRIAQAKARAARGRARSLLSAKRPKR